MLHSCSMLCTDGGLSLAFMDSMVWLMCSCIPCSWRLASDRRSGKCKFNGIVDCIRTTVKQQGITGLYTGTLVLCSYCLWECVSTIGSIHWRYHCCHCVLLVGCGNVA